MSRQCDLVSLLLLFLFFSIFFNPLPSNSVIVTSRWHRSLLFELHRRFLQHHDTPRMHQAANHSMRARTQTHTHTYTHTPMHARLKDSTAGSEKGKGGLREGGPKTWSEWSRERKPKGGKCSCDQRLVYVSTTSHLKARVTDRMA